MGRFLRRLLVLILALLALWLVFARVTGRQVTILGVSVLAVQTDSMSPTLPAGSLIVVREPQADSRIAPGDIITFRSAGENTLITHRVLRVLHNDNGEEWYETQGDNPASSPDPYPVWRDEVIGVFWFKIK